MPGRGGIDPDDLSWDTSVTLIVVIGDLRTGA
jgi:hypothetical protein